MLRTRSLTANLGLCKEIQSIGSGGGLQEARRSGGHFEEASGEVGDTDCILLEFSAVGMLG